MGNAKDDLEKVGSTPTTSDKASGSNAMHRHPLTPGFFPTVLPR